MDPREIGWEGVIRMNLAQDRYQWRAVMKTVMNLQVTQKAGNVTISSSRRTVLHGVSYLQILTYN
jgi:hypothetical protein